MNSEPFRLLRSRRQLWPAVLALWLVFLSGPGLRAADVPPRLHFQGRVTVGGVPFNGAGQFKFALVRPVRDGRTATAQALVTLDGQGQLGLVEVTDGGAGYVAPPAVTVSDPAGTGAQLQTVVAEGRVVAITVVTAGSGYSSPVLSVAPPAPATLWSHDGTSAGGAPPVSAVPLEVTRGLYAVDLGDTTRPHMTQPVAPAVLAGGDAALRVWFDDGTHGFQQLTPDQPLASVGYAMMAQSLAENPSFTGASTFNGRMSFGTSLADTKLALYDEGGTSYGLGVQPFQFRLHLDSPNARFSFLDAPVGNELFTILGNGRVGIGTTSPQSALHVNGSVTAQTFLGDGAGLTGNIGVGTTSPGYKLTVKGSANEVYSVMSEDGTETSDNLKVQIAPGGGTSSTRIGYLIGNFGGWNGFLVANNRSAPLRFGTANFERMRIDASGNVGIGTSSPSEKLEVNGTVKATRFEGDGGGLTFHGELLVDGVPVLRLPGGDNRLLAGAGGAALTGGGNTAVGAGALANTTSGDGNTVLGLGALIYNAAGSDNVAVGREALLQSTGHDNIGLGAIAGWRLQTGDHNIYLGHPGETSESGTIRIGTPGKHTATHLAGTVHAETLQAGTVKAQRFEGDGSGLHNVPGTLATTTTVRAWGFNGVGQTTVPPGLHGVTAIAAGGYHTVALKTDGTVVAWGNNFLRQATVPAGLSGVTAIAAGESHTVALKADGTVVAWGDNLYGQTTVPPGLSGVTAIAAGGYHTVALRTDGTVVAWGDNGSGQTTVPPGLSSVTAIAAGGYHTVALKTDGTVVAWGSNLYGQTTVPAGLSGVTAIAAGFYHTVALKTDGTVVAWGDNGLGQRTVPAGLSGVTAIAAGASHTVALKSDGTVVAWGNNSRGQTTVPPELHGVTAIAAGGGHTVALTGTSLLTSNLEVQGMVTAMAFNTTSDRNAKANFQPVDPQAVLAKVAALPITQWNFKGSPGEAHLGPMAQDFRAAFGLGPDERHIATVDADGVALAAIQGLNQKLTDKDREVARLKAELRQFQERLQRLEQALRSAP